MFLKFAKFAKLAKNILNTRQTRTCQNVAICGTRQTRPHSPQAIFLRKMWIAKFARVAIAYQIFHSLNFNHERD